jgi:hypothetical protein
MDRFAALKADIDREVRNLERLTREMDEILGGAPEGSVVKVRAAGSVLHDFSTGVEKIFRRIAARIDQDLPTGENWHIQLLQRMAVPVEGIRPRGREARNRSRRISPFSSSFSQYIRFRAQMGKMSAVGGKPGQDL